MGIDESPRVTRRPSLRLRRRGPRPYQRGADRLTTAGVWQAGRSRVKELRACGSEHRGAVRGGRTGGPVKTGGRLFSDRS